MTDGLSNDALQFWYGQNKISWKGCEPSLISTCQAFADCWPECVPAVGNRSSFYAGIRKIVREVGEADGPDFVRFAKDEIEQRDRARQARNLRPLDIIDGHSIYFLTVEWKKAKMGKTDRCPTCGDHWSMCRCEWGSKKRREQYDRYKGYDD